MEQGQMILIVDDRRMLIETRKAYFENRVPGCECISATTSVEAVSKAIKYWQDLKLIMIDVWLPEERTFGNLQYLYTREDGLASEEASCADEARLIEIRREFINLENLIYQNLVHEQGVKTMLEILSYFRTVSGNPSLLLDIPTLYVSSDGVSKKITDRLNRIHQSGKWEVIYSNLLDLDAKLIKLGITS